MSSRPAAPAIQIAQVVRNYGSLRPLRIAALAVAPGERVALTGLDAGAAEVLVNLVTGAALPDEGEVRVFGRATSEIASGDEWLASLERFGIVSPRAVLIEGATVLQNLAMPFTWRSSRFRRRSPSALRRWPRSAGLREPATPGGSRSGQAMCRETCARVFIWRAPSRSSRHCYCWNIRRPESTNGARGAGGRCRASARRTPVASLAITPGRYVRGARRAPDVGASARHRRAEAEAQGLVRGDATSRTHRTQCAARR